MVQQILRDHPDAINTVDSDGYSPLHKACYNNNVPLAKLLLAHGADVNARTEFEWTPLHSSCQWMHPECVALLLAHGSDVNAKTSGCEFIYSFLLLPYVMVHNIPPLAQTPLHIAASVSHCRDTAVSLLFHPDVQPHVRNNSNDTAAELARRTGPTSAIFEMGHPAFQNTIGLID